MRRLLLILVVSMLPGLAFAAGDSKSKFDVFGFYGINTLSPGDVNGVQKTFANPKPGDITTGTTYGGGFGLMLGQKWKLKATFDLLEAKNLASNGAGFDLTQNTVWADLDYMLINTGRMYVYAGAGVGYPVLSHAKVVSSGVTTDADADKTLGYNAEAGLGFMLGSHFSIFFQGGYQYVVSGDVKNSAGAKLLNASGQNAKIDLSGIKGLGGLAVMF